jgi:flagellar hook-associated protein 2
MSSVGLSSSDLASLLGTSTGSSSSGIDLSSLLEAATGASTAGIDVTSAVNAAMSAAEAPETQWQAQQTAIQSQESDLTTMSGSATTVENDLAALNSFTGPLASVDVSSSDSNLATAYATGAAASGTHVVNVTNLATTASWYSASPVATSSTGLAAGSFSLQVGSGTPAQIAVTSGETLTQLASAITGLGLGVTASVVSDASGARLSIVSNNSGSASNFTITNTSQQMTKASDGSGWNSGSISDTAGATSGSFSIQVGSGAATQITATSGESLSALASDINGRSLGVTANVVSEGDGSSHLSIVNTATGDGSGMTISNTSPQFTQAATGANASLTVDGIPISSASNTVTGAVSGLTINLLGADAKTNVTLTATADSSTITAAINQFVTDYNTLIGQVNDEFTYNSTSTTAPPLEGDSTVESLQNYLLGAGSYVASGNGSISTLGSLGISMNNDGTLSVDSTTLDNAVQNNTSAVQQFFEGTTLNGFSATLSNQLQSLTDSSDGAFTVEISNLQSNYNDLQDNITNFQDNYLTPLKASLTAEYDAAEIALQELSTTTQEVNAELGNNTSSSGN